MRTDMPGDTDEPAEGGSPGTVALIERSIVLLLVLGLLVGVLSVLRPFTTAILFGSATAIAAWPLRQVMVRRGFKRGIAAALLLLLVLVVIVVPLLILAPALTEQLGQGMQRVEAYIAGAPSLPSWLAGLPAVGSRIALGWDTVVRAQGDVHAVVALYEASLRGILLTVA